MIHTLSLHSHLLLKTMCKVSSPLVHVAAIRKNQTLQVFENKVQSLFLW